MEIAGSLDIRTLRRYFSVALPPLKEALILRKASDEPRHPAESVPILQAE
jgi:hypothetical protein